VAGQGEPIPGAYKVLGPNGVEWRLPVASLAGMFEERSLEPPPVAEPERVVEQPSTTELIATMGRLVDTLDEERRLLHASERERRNLEREVTELRVEHARLTERLEAELERREWAEEEAERLIAGAEGVGGPVRLAPQNVAWQQEEEAARRRLRTRQGEPP
jgi:hypothetical protein